MSEQNNASNGNKEEAKLVQIPTSIHHFRRAIYEASKVADITKDIEIETAHPGEFKLQLNERRTLLMEGLKSSVHWSYGAKVGLASFAAFQAWNLACGRFLKRSFITPRSVAFDAGASGIIATCFAFGGASAGSVTELPLRPGYPSKTVEDYCPIVMRHVTKAIKEENGGVITNPSTSNGHILNRAYETCLMRQTYEHALRRDDGLSKTEPVFVPEPGVPEDIFQTSSDDLDEVIKSIIEDPKYLSLWAEQHAMDQEEHAKMKDDDGARP